MEECVRFKYGVPLTQLAPQERTNNYSPNAYHDKARLTIHHEFNEFPNVIQYDDVNPTIYSPNELCDIQFYMTKESLLDADLYRQFVGNAVGRFRRSRAYKDIKAGLMSAGMDHCQVMGYIKAEEMATVEMHHNIIGIRDIAVMITEHVVNTVGIISSFDLVQILIEEHRLNNVPIVMLSETMHEKYHSDPNSFLPPNMTFGKWWELLYNYRYGITIDIANKVIWYINKTVNSDDPYKDFWVQLRKDIKDWSGYNVYGMDPGVDNSIGIIPDTILDINLKSIT
jgi:virulence-associated protein VapD